MNNPIKDPPDFDYYVYDEMRCNGRIPSQTEAEVLLADLNSGRAIPHPIADPGYKQRLKDIIAGRSVDPEHFQWPCDSEQQVKPKPWHHWITNFLKHAKGKP